MNKTNLLIFSLVISIIVFSACKKSDFEHNSDFDKSYSAWLDFKINSGNSYQYTVLQTSWSGMSWQTIITIEKGKIFRRHFKLIVPVDWVPEIPSYQKEWIEEGNEIGSRKDSGAADAITLEEVYARAKNDWLKKRDKVTTYFEAKNNGLLSSCGFIEDGCADDCFKGINIIEIKKKNE